MASDLANLANCMFTFRLAYGRALARVHRTASRSYCLRRSLQTEWPPQANMTEPVERPSAVCPTSRLFGGGHPTARDTPAPAPIVVTPTRPRPGRAHGLPGWGCSENERLLNGQHCPFQSAMRCTGHRTTARTARHGEGIVRSSDQGVRLSLAGRHVPSARPGLNNLCGFGVRDRCASAGPARPARLDSAPHRRLDVRLRHPRAARARRSTRLSSPACMVSSTRR